MTEKVSETMERLHRARDVAWAALQPVFDHAIALAKEVEYHADAASIQVQARIMPAYPPLVEMLAWSVPPVKEDGPPF